MEFTPRLHDALKNTKLNLQKENGWDDDFVNMAVNEYGKFLHLRKIAMDNHSDKRIVPGEVVYKIWHDHILHTKQYIEFCEKEFGGYLHHDPTDSLMEETIDFNSINDLYEGSFGYKPPKLFWPVNDQSKKELNLSSTQDKQTKRKSVLQLLPFGGN